MDPKNRLRPGLRKFMTLFAADTSPMVAYADMAVPIVALAVAAFAGGWAIALAFAHAPIDRVGGWTVASIAASGLCLGFGIATLFWWRLRRDGTAELRRDVGDVRLRAIALLEALDREDKPHRVSSA
jgi:hypothetical protein